MLPADGNPPAFQIEICGLLTLRGRLKRVFLAVMLPFATHDVDISKFFATFFPSFKQNKSISGFCHPLPLCFVKGIKDKTDFGNRCHPGLPPGFAPRNGMNEVEFAPMRG